MSELPSSRSYHPSKIEAKWQAFWEKEKTFKCEIDHDKTKYYILDMLPYPSGDGLHIGHPVGYTATDVLARYKRKLGFNVLHPMGWDSFGLPAEQYAIRTGVHPKVTTEKNIKNIKRQLKRIGFAYDWDREIKTSDPNMYKWTQWIFTKLYEKGLAYQDELMVNFCPALGTVLSNEEVIDGKSEVGGHPVERRPLRQWVLKITHYADQLLQDLEDLDWPEGIKKLQRNWIGKSIGAHIHFTEEKTQEKITVFSTRAETLFAASFLVLAPEHPLVSSITSKEQKASVEAYVESVKHKSDLERAELTKDKTGVFTGAYAKNPITNESIPIWIADYVLITYGTGAVMAVAAHDERDFEFAQKYHLPIKPVILPKSSDKQYEAILKGEVCFSGSGVMSCVSKDHIDVEGLKPKEARNKLVYWLEETGYGEKTINYKLRDWLFSRQRYWGEPIPILHYEDGTIRALDEDELPLLPPDNVDYKPSPTGESPLSQAKDWVEIVDPKTGRKAFRETNTMPQWAGSCWYYLRYLDPNNDQKAFSLESEKYWMPVDLYVGGAEHAVLHLLYARFWHKVLYDCGLVTTKEPFKSLRNQGVVTARSYRLPNKGYIRPEEVVEKDGAHFHKETGKSLASQIEKMSKSKLNGVSPDDIIDGVGADALRMYEMFMAPLDKEKVWSDNGLQGCYRFLNRFYDLCLSDKVVEETIDESLKYAHVLLKGANEDIESYQFNTAISKLMIFLNQQVKLSRVSKEALLIALHVLYPLAPHIACELWEELGQSDDLAHAPYPKWEQKYLEEASAVYVVQVNGKLRGKFELPKNQSEEAIIELARKNENIEKHLSGEIVKTIFVPNKLINFVVKA